MTNARPRQSLWGETIAHWFVVAYDRGGEWLCRCTRCGHEQICSFRDPSGYVPRCKQCRATASGFYVRPKYLR